MKRTTRPPKILFVWVGRAGDSILGPAVDDYVERIGRFLPVAVKWIRPGTGDGPGSVTDESRRLQEACRDAGSVWLFDRLGPVIDSPGLAHQLTRDLENRPSPICLVVGGPAGVNEDLEARADRRISFGPMTFPHPIARLLAAEQLFRALTLKERVPYHK